MELHIRRLDTLEEQPTMEQHHINQHSESLVIALPYLTQSRLGIQVALEHLSSMG